MKLLFFLSLIVSTTLRADGLDQLHVYLNGQLIFKSEEGKKSEAHILHVGDTLIFEASTDWSLLETATLTLDGIGDDHQKVIFQERSNFSGAKFMYIVKKEDLNTDFKVFLNYNVSGIEPSVFLEYKAGVFQ